MLKEVIFRTQVGCLFMQQPTEKPLKASLLANY